MLKRLRFVILTIIVGLTPGVVLAGTPDFAAEVLLDRPTGLSRLGEPAGASVAADSSGQRLGAGDHRSYSRRNAGPERAPVGV